MAYAQTALEFAKCLKKIKKPIGKIAFIITNVFHCEHYQEIMRHLGDLVEALVMPLRASDLPQDFVSSFCPISSNGSECI